MKQRQDRLETIWKEPGENKISVCSIPPYLLFVCPCLIFLVISLLKKESVCNQHPGC
jgi:hypothetical protein